MEQQTQQRVKVYYDRRVMPQMASAKNIERLFIECGTGDESYRVTVKPVADWYELKGKVDSKRTHDIVMSMVQSNHPYRKIVDLMTIVQGEA